MSLFALDQRPLSAAEFYLLLVLYINEGHTYSLRGRMAALSGGLLEDELPLDIQRLILESSKA
jgi:hypothetical protein